jgi:NTE family protein
MAGFYDRKVLERHDQSRVVGIPTGTYSTLDLGLADVGKEWLFSSGQKAARDFLNSFDWEQYKQKQMRARRKAAR